MNRRQFFKLCAAGAATSAISALGLLSEKAYAAVREFKLLRAKETRNNCPYCSVGCGLLMYSQGSGGKNSEHPIFHIEGDADHPVNRGALCPKGAGLVTMLTVRTVCSTLSIALRAPMNGSASAGAKLTSVLPV